MDKPERKIRSAVYNWNDIQDFIEGKYKVKLRGYKPEHDSEYRDFWHWLVDTCDIMRGCFFHLPEDYKGSAKWWQIEIMDMILTEFPELKTEKIWVDW